MAFPPSSSGIVPWMNGRIDAGAGNELPQSTTVSFTYGTNVVLKWIEDGTYTNPDIPIFGHGRWGTDTTDDNHYVVSVATTSLPPTTTYTVADRTALFAITGMYQYNTALVTSDNSYWEYLGGVWVRLVQKVNAGTVLAYSVTATIYTITVPQSDLPKVRNTGIREGGYYDLCWNQNGLHSLQYDAAFNITPSGYRIYDEIPDRTELNTRVAGEKGLFEDEFVTAAQLEAGSGISIKYRNRAGILAGYATDSVKGGNIVLEATESSLEGALSTVWIKDQAGDTAVGFGYDGAAFINTLFIGPWGWQNAPGSTIPYNLSNYSNNAKDTQWDWGSSQRSQIQSAYTRFGKVSKSGLYLISGTTQGYRWVSPQVASDMIPFINTRIHYYLLVRRRIADLYVNRIYKSLDIEPWDLWTWPSVTIDNTARALFIEKMSSLPWSVQGTAQIWLEEDDEIAHMISYNGGNGGETRISYQVCYHAFEGILLADEKTLDPLTQVNLNPINEPDPYTAYHQMQFINV